MNSTELRQQTVALLPDREALGHVTVTVADVHAKNSAFSAVVGSYCSSSLAAAGQTIIVG